MRIEVVRDQYSSLSTLGQLLIDGYGFCYTLEPPVRQDGVKPRAIPTGIYPLTVRWSPEFHKHVPHVENVPGFTAIEQHIGNFPKDTKGCTLVGLTRGPAPDFIGNSLKAFVGLMAAYLKVATLANPEEKSESSHVWKVGEVIYRDSRDWTGVGT